ncbi:MAG: hypothetical protein HHJ17_07440 [Rhodoferax sp.]|uniref:hypothetical protein n=1 Tax=Rhodoferax sp. TaxID=50421 RepID=UPI00180DEDCD|nr:hypothetical protein [Rhodoferax sp.]NMM13355.1 hypothetical protein [Rhodoferax sp.]
MTIASFIKFSGFTREEWLGLPHNLVRYPGTLNTIAQLHPELARAVMQSAC